MTALSLLRLIPEPGRLAAGRILFEGRDLAELSESAMERVRGRDIGMIFQEPMSSLNPSMRIDKQMIEGIRLHTPLTKAEARKKAADILSQVGIPDPQRVLKNYPHQLSGGMRQRVMIAMALACEPDILIADEPTTALDVTIQAQILELMKKIQQDKGMSILLITHDLGVVAEMADEVGVMYAGRIVERAPVRALFAEPRHPYTWGLIRSAPTLDTPPSAKLDAIPGTVPSPGDLPQGCPFRPRCPEAHERCFKTPPVIESAGADGAREVCCWLAEAR